MHQNSQISELNVEDFHGQWVSPDRFWVGLTVPSFPQGPDHTPNRLF